MKPFFGSHISQEDGLIEGAKKIKNAGGNFLQIFLTIPGSMEVKSRTLKELDDFRDYLKENNMGVVIHSSYLHNLSREWDSYSWWIRNIIQEIEYSHRIEALGIVIHFGKRLDLSVEEAYNNMFTSLIHIHNKTKDYSSVRIILETSTGQGTELCYKLEDLAYFYKKFSRHKNEEIRERFGLCIDTCHIFSAGYDIKTKKSVKLYIETFEEMIGLRHVKLIHLNDSRVEQGSKVDRHDNIGRGFIGLEGLVNFFLYFYKLQIPIVLETPNNGYRMEIKRLLDRLEI